MKTAFSCLLFLVLLFPALADPGLQVRAVSKEEMALNRELRMVRDLALLPHLLSPGEQLPLMSLVRLHEGGRSTRRGWSRSGEMEFLYHRGADISGSRRSYELPLNTGFEEGLISSAWVAGNLVLCLDLEVDADGIVRRYPSRHYVLPDSWKAEVMRMLADKDLVDRMGKGEARTPLEITWQYAQTRELTLTRFLEWLEAGDVYSTAVLVSGGIELRGVILGEVRAGDWPPEKVRGLALGLLAAQSFGQSKIDRRDAFRGYLRKYFQERPEEVLATELVKALDR